MTKPAGLTGQLVAWAGAPAFILIPKREYTAQLVGPPDVADAREHARDGLESPAEVEVPHVRLVQLDVRQPLPRDLQLVRIDVDSLAPVPAA